MEPTGRPDPMSQPPPDHPRRRFFHEAAVRAVGPLADYLASRLDPPETAIWLRPPGAIDETRFLEACRRCGACVDICPADAIYLIRGQSDAIDGTPAITPGVAPCVVCDGLQCTTVCPSGALLALTDASEIRMGLAAVDADRCLRATGEDCTLCVDRCPLGPVAIRFGGDGPPEVLGAGCVGCGVCQHACPPEPEAVVVHRLR